MKRINFYVPIILLLAFVCSPGCSKTMDQKEEEAPSIRERVYADQRAGNTWSGAAKSGNSEDSIGYLHNLGVDYLVSIDDNYTVRTTIDDQVAYDTSSAFYANRYGSTSINAFKSSFPKSAFITLTSADYADVISATSYSNSVKSKLTDLFELILDTTASYASEYSTLKDEIVSWENSVIDDRFFSSNDKKFLLSIGSISRYSLLYWNTVKDNNDPNLRSRPKRGLFGWLLIGVGDIMGGIAGSGFGPVGIIVAGGIASGVIYAYT